MTRTRLPTAFELAGQLHAERELSNELLTALKDVLACKNVRRNIALTEALRAADAAIAKAGER